MFFGLLLRLLSLRFRCFLLFLVTVVIADVLSAPAKSSEPAPFTLTATEAEDLDNFLQRWEERCRGLKNYYYQFELLEFDRLLGPNQWIERDGQQVLIPRHQAECTGVLLYQGPDHSLYQIQARKIWQPSPNSASSSCHAAEEGQYVLAKEDSEQLISTSQSLWMVYEKSKSVYELELPSERTQVVMVPQFFSRLFSKNLEYSDPTPTQFLVGGTAKELKERFHLRIVTPKESKEDTWVEFWPRNDKNYEPLIVARMILNQKLAPATVQLITSRSERVYILSEQKENQPDNEVPRIAAPEIPSDWEHLRENLREFAPLDAS